MENLTAKDIMTADLFVVGADWDIERLTEFLLRNSISGAPVISSEGELLGVVSVTDIALFHSMPLQEVAVRDMPNYYDPSFDLLFSAEEMDGYRVETEKMVKVRDIMTSVVIKVPEDAPIFEVAEMMIRGRIHRLFVTQNDELVGVISAFDLLKTIRPPNPCEC
jgi:CBS domain-containing protein